MTGDETGPTLSSRELGVIMSDMEPTPPDYPEGVRLTIHAGPPPVERWDPVSLGEQDVEEWLYVTYDANFNLIDIRAIDRTECSDVAERYIYHGSCVRGITDDAQRDTELDGD